MFKEILFKIFWQKFGISEFEKKKKKIRQISQNLLPFVPIF